jgi:diguanylate cyclase (GGDEF)-like protein
MFLPVAVICIGGAVFLFRSEVDADLARIHSSEVTALRVGVGSIGHVAQSISRDLAYLAVQEGLIEVISHENQLVHGHLLADWLAFSRAKGIYDQIRWLDLNGQERVRVDFNNGKPAGVPEDKLQDKGKRYYFTVTIKLNRGEIFFSALDLNVESGKIEHPLKPMIRVCTPVFDLEGKKQGIMVLNYLGERMLQEFGRMMGATVSRAWLLNPEGYWLKGPSADLEWGFMYQRPEASMAYRYPESWKRILTAEQEQFEDKHGLWTLATVYPLVEGEKASSRTHEAFAPSRPDLESRDYFWKAVLLLPREEYRATRWQTGIKLSVATTVLLGGLFIGCWRLASAGVHMKEAEEEVRRVNQGLAHTVEERTKELQGAKRQAEEQARSDALTGMNNRRAFFEYGMVIDEQASRYGRPYALIMLDIDWFKKINDAYGHLIGDEALKAVATSITEVIRSSDVAGRIGGEEFAIILPETSEEDASKSAERLRRSIANIVIPVDSGDLSFTASIGIAVRQNEDSSVGDVLGRADGALYLAKGQGRNRVVLFQS